MRNIIHLLFFAAVGMMPLSAQELLRDINLASPNGSNPRHLAAANGLLFFAAYSHPDVGTELWKTDGSTASLVKDIRPGLSGTNNHSSPDRLTEWKGKLYFVANDGTHGTELWVSDGSEGGTQMVMDIRPGTNSADPQQLTPSGDYLYFTADDGLAGRELWKTDGTPGGTERVKDINPGVGPSTPTWLMMWNDTLFFSAYEPATGFELWRSEGTAASTRRVRDLNKGTNGANPSWITVFNDRLVFAATRGYAGEGYGLFLSRGDSLTTTTLKLFGTSGGIPRNLTVLNNLLVFWVNGPVGGSYKGYEPWVSNGTFYGTVLLDDIYPGPSGSMPSGGPSPVILGDQVLFVANSPNKGLEIWTTDGTAAGTEILADIVPGTGGSYPDQLLRVGNEVFFWAANVDHKGLWKTNGTEAGTVPVKDFDLLPPTYAGVSFIYEGAAFEGSYFFTADVNGSGSELWKSNGTAADTVQVTDLHPETSSSNIPEFAATENLLFFPADDGIHGKELWRTDGTPEGTVMVKDIRPGWESASPGLLTIVNDLLFFFADDGAAALWVSDGTEAGTVRIREFTQLGGRPVVFNGLLFFPAAEGNSGVELWRSDGTEAGTVMVKDIDKTPNVDGLCHYNAPVGGSFPLTVFNNQLLFCGAGELWTSDGTTDGTALLADLNPTGSSYPDRFYPVGGLAFFVADNGTNGRELWKFNGSTGNASMVIDLNGLFIGDSHPHGFFDAGNWLFLTSWDGYTYEQWVTNGTSSGTYRRENFQPNVIMNGPIIGGPTEFFYAASAKDGSTGKELWKGPVALNAAATLIQDINPGSAPSSPGWLTLADPSLFFFAANDGTHGTELWKSDGTPDGTVLMKDIYPGSTSSSPASLIAWKGALYFTATDYEHGMELWKYTFMPLPVSWLRFRAECVDKEVRLEWQTATENNNRGFEVQRRSASGQWQVIGFVEGAGNLTTTSYYTWWDTHPQSGVSYYRLRQIDWDGRENFSHIESVRFPTGAIAVYPNPSSGFVYLEVPDAAMARVRLIDATGHLVADQTLAAGESILDLQSLPAGIYLLQVTAGAETFTTRIIRE